MSIAKNSIVERINEMVQPWFEPNEFGAWYGTIAGSGAGLLGGVVGTLAGVMGPRGIGRKWILGLMYGGVALGLLQLLFGIYALLAGQPWGIWYGPVLCGAMPTIVFGALTPVVRLRYRQAEERRVEAEGLRKSLA
jgi:hypothetical protein